MKDSELIQKVHSGNKEAVGIIIERYYADIYRFCLYMVQTEDDAYDIAQETFLKFMKYGTSSYNQVFFIENSRFFNLSYLSE